MNEEPVEYAYEDQAFDNSENLAGKMTTPRNHYYLCYASLLALLLCHCYDAYHLLASLPSCHVKPLTHHCPSKPLIGYVTALLSPLL